MQRTAGGRRDFDDRSVQCHDESVHRQRERGRSAGAHRRIGRRVVAGHGLLHQRGDARPARRRWRLGADGVASAHGRRRDGGGGDPVAAALETKTIEKGMPNPFESATLNLKLYELRREPVLREARDWFLREFNPETLEELITIVGGGRNASFRMVLGYWDMAASLVTTGAIDADAFRAAHGEMFAAFSKIHPFLSELRQAGGEPGFCQHLEAVVLGAPDAEAILSRRRQALRAAAAARAARGADKSCAPSAI